MPDSRDTALILCPAGDAIHRRLLGLTIGERTLLALAHSGVRRVAFAGPGPRPTCDRAELTEVAVDAATSRSELLVVAADAVFDRGLVKGEVPAGLPMARLPAAAAREAAADPEGWLARNRTGRAEVPGFALRVTDKASAAQARRALLRALRKPVDGPVSKYLNRHISIFVSSWLVRLPLRPNQLTVLFTLIGAASGVLAAFGEPFWMIWLAAFLFQAQSVLDGCDGEIARLTYRFSLKGQWLDSIGDDITNYSFCLGLALGQARAQDVPELYWAGGITLAAQLLATVVLYRRMYLLGIGDLLAIPDTLTGGGADGPMSKVMYVLRQLAKRDVFVLGIALIAVVSPVIAFLVYAAGTFPMVIAVVVNDRRLARAEPDPAGSAPIPVQPG